MKRFTALFSALLFSAGLVLASSAPAQAAACGTGNFCVWTDANFGGMKVEWPGDDRWWESNIADEDSSWANHGVSGPGVKDHVRVYSRAHLGGHMTICLTPGQEVGYNGAANDNGDSHTWAMSC